MKPDTENEQEWPTIASNPFDECIGEYFAMLDESGTEKHDSIRDEIQKKYPQFVQELQSFFDRENSVGAFKAMVDPQVDQPPGETQTSLHVVGNYALLERIGSGGMGEVYRARQITTGRVVTVKMLKFTASKERFRREIEISAQFEHPNIVRLYEAGEENGRQFYAMEYIAGGSLADQKNPTPRQIATWISKVAQALEEAHQKDVLHRDIKPENILLDSDGEPRVADFGLARLNDADQTVSLGVIGTFQYMSPEQAAGRNVDLTAASDVYSLGATMYRLLAGRPPFVAADLNRLLVQIQKDSPVSIRSTNRDVAVDLERICLKCLEKKPEDRYHRATDLSEDLERFLQGKPVLARPLGTPKKLVRWAGREPKLALAFAGILTTLLIGIAASNWFRIQANQNASAARISERSESRLRIKSEHNEKTALLNKRLSDLKNYSRTIDSGQRMVLDGDIEEARRLLASVPKDLRGFEYGLSRRGLNSSFGETTISFLEQCTSIAVGPKAISSPNRPSIVVCGTDAGGVWVGSLANQKLDHFKLDLHLSTASGFISALALSETGRFLVAGTSGGRIAVTDLTQPKRNVIAKFELPGIVSAVNIHLDPFELQNGVADIQIAACDLDGNIGVWSVADEEKIFTGKWTESDINAIAVGNKYSPVQLAVGDSNGTLVIWRDVNDSLPDFSENHAHPGGVFDLELTASGVATCGADGNRIEWTPQSRADSLDLLSSELRRAQFPRIHTGQLGAMTAQVIWIGVDPKATQQNESKLIGCFLEDLRNGNIRKIATGLDDELLSGTPVRIDISGDGTFSAVAIGSRVILHLAWPDYFSVPMEKSVVCRMPGVRLNFHESPATFVLVDEIPDLNQSWSFEIPVVCLAQNHDKTSIVTADTSGEFKLWNRMADHMEAVPLNFRTPFENGNLPAIKGIAFSEDDSMILVNRGTNLEIYQLDGELSGQIELDEEIVVFESSKNGKQILVCTNQALRVYESESWNLTKEIELSGPVNAATYSANGNLVAVITGRDSIQLIDLVDDSVITLKHRDATAVLFHPEEDRLFSIGDRLKIWETQSGERMWDEALLKNNRSPFRLSLVDESGAQLLLAIAEKGDYWQLQTWMSDSNDER